jgi:O-antigen/teichoic acid export membrane protein
MENRTQIFSKNLNWIILIKIFSGIANYLIIGILYRQLSDYQFGYWSILSLIYGWAVFFDFGIGNALRNKIVYLSSAGEDAKIPGIIGAGYFLNSILAVVFATVFTLCIIIVIKLDIYSSWRYENAEVVFASIITLVGFCTNLVVGNIRAIFLSQQKSALTTWVQFTIHLSNIIGLLVLIVIKKPTLVDVSIVYTASIILNGIYYNLNFFHRNKDLFPRLDNLRTNGHTLFRVGYKFFIIQLSALMVFSTDRIVYLVLFSPENVSQIETISRIYAIIPMIFMLYSAPLWSLFSDSYAKKDSLWIYEQLTKQLKLLIILLFISIIIFIFRSKITLFWLGEVILYPQYLAETILVLNLLICWNHIWSTLLNGIGRLNIQVYLAIMCIFLNLPLSIIFARHTSLQEAGVSVATILCLLPCGIIMALQAKREISSLKI